MAFGTHWILGSHDGGYQLFCGVKGDLGHITGFDQQYRVLAVSLRIKNHPFFWSMFFSFCFCRIHIFFLFCFLNPNEHFASTSICAIPKFFGNLSSLFESWKMKCRGFLVFFCLFYRANNNNNIFLIYFIYNSSEFSMEAETHWVLKSDSLNMPGNRSLFGVIGRHTIPPHPHCPQNIHHF